MSIFDDPNFDEMFQNAIYNSREDVVDAVDSEEWDDLIEPYDDWDDDPFGIDDGQPTHYEEMQDVYGGDDYVEQWEVE
tara:strand:+ start:89 stop:322 length:234 start_codon:yes stop_codon:yes gene_type:complete